MEQNYVSVTICIATARITCGRVYMVRCLFNLSTAAAACGGFAAGRQRAGDVDRLLHRALSSNGAAAANASSVTFTAALWLNTGLISGHML